MTVDRTHNLNHQTRYELRGDTGLACALTYTAEPADPESGTVIRCGAIEKRKPSRISG
jgi:hypothetical protein